jgi:hypothetical protein
VLSHSPTDDSDEERLDLVQKCASALYSDGRYEEAEKLQVQVMETRKRVLGDEHPNTLITMHSLAFSLQSRARHEEVVTLMERCFQSRQRILGEQHPDTQSSLNALNSWRSEYIHEIL